MLSLYFQVVEKPMRNVVAIRERKPGNWLSEWLAEAAVSTYA
jgi:hypothetical protein